MPRLQSGKKLKKKSKNPKTKQEIQNINKLSKRYIVTFIWSYLGSLEKENIKHTHTLCQTTAPGTTAKSS